MIDRSFLDALDEAHAEANRQRSPVFVFRQDCRFQVSGFTPGHIHNRGPFPVVKVWPDGTVELGIDNARFDDEIQRGIHW